MPQRPCHSAVFSPALRPVSSVSTVSTEDDVCLAFCSRCLARCGHSACCRRCRLVQTSRGPDSGSDGASWILTVSTVPVPPCHGYKALSFFRFKNSVFESVSNRTSLSRRICFCCRGLQTNGTTVVYELPLIDMIDLIDGVLNCSAVAVFYFILHNVLAGQTLSRQENPGINRIEVWKAGFERRRELTAGTWEAPKLLRICRLPQHLSPDRVILVRTSSMTAIFLFSPIRESRSNGINTFASSTASELRRHFAKLQLCSKQ